MCGAEAEEVGGGGYAAAGIIARTETGGRFEGSYLALPLFLHVSLYLLILLPL